MSNPTGFCYAVLLVCAAGFLRTTTGFWPKTPNGADCMNECLARTPDEGFTCRTQDGEGMCSPFHNVTSSGEACARSTEGGGGCGAHGYKYHWCVLEKPENDDDGGSGNRKWGFCGRNAKSRSPSAVSSTYRAFCLDECAPRDKSYYWCTTYRGWDYCSPYWDTTATNDSCSPDHYCDTHGKTYYWCRTTTESEPWGYCSPHLDCAYWPADDHAPAVSRSANECKVLSRAGNQAISLLYGREPLEPLQDYGDHKAAALQAIADWTPVNAKPPRPNDQLARIELQKQNEDYRYFRLRLNLASTPWRRAMVAKWNTVAAVALPASTTVNVRFARRALVESLNRRRLTVVQVKEIRL